MTALPYVLAAVYLLWFLLTRTPVVALAVLLWRSEYNHHDGSLRPTFLGMSLLLVPFVGEAVFGWFFLTRPKDDPVS